MYGKIEDNALTTAPRGVTEGYKHVRLITPIEPPSGYEVEYGWEETEDEIIQTYELIPLSEDLTDSEILAILLGEGDEE